VSSPRTVLVTGAGRGIGRAVAEQFADAGWIVVAGVRDLDRAAADFADRPGIAAVHLDVTDDATIAAAVAEAQRRAGGPIDCLVSNAGYAVLGPVEDVDLDEVRAMFETNFFGAAAVVQAAVPAMREAGRGAVVFVSSIGARFANPLVGMYHASKFALSAMAEALALECRPFGVHVAAIEPGMVDTDFPRATRATGALSRGEGVYAPLLGELRQGFAAWRERNPTPPAAIAALVLAAALDPDGPFRVAAGEDAAFLTRTRQQLTDDAAWQDALLGFLQIDWPRRPPGPSS
jgi:NAD(P)-dependent dehydrogenase (short-subunit alcohol dehydrogenase family)